jgi:hypothetical protein
MLLRLFARSQSSICKAKWVGPQEDQLSSSSALCLAFALPSTLHTSCQPRQALLHELVCANARGGEIVGVLQNGCYMSPLEAPAHGKGLPRVEQTQLHSQGWQVGSRISRTFTDKVFKHKPVDWSHAVHCVVCLTSFLCLVSPALPVMLTTFGCRKQSPVHVTHISGTVPLW